MESLLKSAQIGGVKKAYDYAMELQDKMEEASEARGKGGFLGSLIGKGLPLLLGWTNPLLLALTSAVGSYFGEMSAEDEYQDVEDLYDKAMGATGFGSGHIQRIAREGDIEDITDDLKTGAIKSGLTSAATSFIAADGFDYLKEGGLTADWNYFKENLWGDFMPGGGFDPSTMSLSPMEPMPAAKDYFTIESVQAGRPSEWSLLKEHFPNWTHDQLVSAAETGGQAFGFDIGAIPSRHSTEFSLMDYYANLGGFGGMDEAWIEEYKQNLGI